MVVEPSGEAVSEGEASRWGCECADTLNSTLEDQSVRGPVDGRSCL
jgi:hypothetical protein